MSVIWEIILRCFWPGKLHRYFQNSDTLGAAVSNAGFNGTMGLETLDGGFWLASISQDGCSHGRSRDYQRIRGSLHFKARVAVLIASSESIAFVLTENRLL
jgi:hypothetical protein